MEPPDSPPPSTSNGAGSSHAREHRRHGRVRCAGVRTQFGVVTDLSASGAKVITRRWFGLRKGTVLSLELHHDDGSVTVTGCVMRSRRLSLRSHEIAFEFVDVTDDQRQGILLATRASLRHLSVDDSRQRLS